MSDPRSDRIFKRIFHKHPGLLIPLLNTLLPMEDPIESIVFMPMELHPEVDEGSLSIVDVRCRDEPHYGYFGANSANRIVAKISQWSMRNEDVRPIKRANMANHPIGMMIIKSILRYRLQGLSNRRISKVCNISRDTVNPYVQQAEACCDSLEELLTIEEQMPASLMMAPSVVQSEDIRLQCLLDRMPGILQELSHPHVTRLDVWEEYHRVCTEG